MKLANLIGWAALAITVGTVLFRTGYRMGRDKAVSRSAIAPGGSGSAQYEETAFYFRGVHFLLSDEPDKAIEAFTQAVRINSETVEIYLSLGNLFRARGEVGRAIRIHQNIIARPDLSDQNRTAALFALAEDYRQGGFLDRAVEAYRRVLEVDPAHRKALTGLQALHESEGRWDLALEVLRTLKRVSGQADPRREAHLLLRAGLEIWEQDKKNSGSITPAPSIDPFLAAIKVYPGCVEAYRLLGEAEIERNEPLNAVKHFNMVRKTRPSHFFLLVGPMQKAYALAKDERGFERMMQEAVAAATASPRLILCWGNILEEQGRLEEAIVLLRKGVAAHPASAFLVHRLIRLLGRTGQWQEAGEVSERCLDMLTSRQPVFQCSQCGFKSQDISWKCPQCQVWDTMEPL
ncbi:tetratricopeptide repeat protein [Candidatus Magnetaquicoccus inordinatus]|uniref:tetratricopeptide repeat protein n=1 Tax=Candidatus Magnetaquicoccus inordinatus TaxID=2496818 RepID=UPI00102D0ADD|nr:tetratricopeptide repeat protein [Candidatus Magnetaquicoccus inordinatus]